MSVRSDNHNRIIVALDFPDEKQALVLVEHLDPETCRVKVGKELFTACGPSVVKKLVNSGFDVFLDLKFHDIPATVAGACRAAADLGVWMINVHALGGSKMMDAARVAVEGYTRPPLLIAVTILTSMDDEDIHEIGLTGKTRDNALHLAGLAHTSGLDGVVCSPHEVGGLRRILDEDFILVTPGIRPQNAQLNDQKRVMTPSEAIRLGSNFLVVGRPITAANDPSASFRALLTEVETALTA